MSDRGPDLMASPRVVKVPPIGGLMILPVRNKKKPRHYEGIKGGRGRRFSSRVWTTVALAYHTHILAMNPADGSLFTQPYLDARRDYRKTLNKELLNAVDDLKTRIFSELTPVQKTMLNRFLPDLTDATFARHMTDISLRQSLFVSLFRYCCKGIELYKTLKVKHHVNIPALARGLKLQAMLRLLLSPEREDDFSNVFWNCDPGVVPVSLEIDLKLLYHYASTTEIFYLHQDSLRGWPDGPSCGWTIELQEPDKVLSNNEYVVTRSFITFKGIFFADLIATNGEVRLCIEDKPSRIHPMFQYMLLLWYSKSRLRVNFLMNNKKCWVVEIHF